MNSEKVKAKDLLKKLEEPRKLPFRVGFSLLKKLKAMPSDELKKETDKMKESLKEMMTKEEFEIFQKKLKSSK